MDFGDLSDEPALVAALQAKRIGYDHSTTLGPRQVLNILEAAGYKVIGVCTLEAGQQIVWTLHKESVVQPQLVD
ncbi:hypothetical protein PFISCL1PPCAC_7831 [Pristionchus fissidentatus]|uniref:GTP cyclohydrolase 1 feedback regulatory protein n=1 Tax=Pristionchus fissidentatus TaxID=1538716 RepID=A0AAV5VAS2_9BILA|nr:hypothetical protein PFISCL1PPCAC_7831 [Pristionchus fissidentatus]